MTLKFGTVTAAAVLLVGAAVGYAQQAQQARPAEEAPQAASAAGATSSTATATPTAASKSPAAPSAAKSPTDTQGDDSGLSSAQLKEARDDGFKPVTRGKATLYCKSEVLVGTAFPMHICYNADRLKVEMQQEEAERMQLQQMHSGGMSGH